MSLELNKISAAVLVSGIIAMITGIAAETLYHGGGHEEKEAKRGYTVEGAETASEEGGEAAPSGPVDIATYLASADAAAGEAVSKKCMSCHDLSKGGPNKIGPNLWGVVGRARASHGGFAYSDALKAKGGNWDYQSLSEFIEAPAKDIPGTKMSFAGVKKPQDRANLLAYLQKLSDSPVAFPAAKAPSAADAKKAAEPTKPGNEPGKTSAVTPAAKENKTPAKAE